MMFVMMVIIYMCNAHCVYMYIMIIIKLYTNKHFKCFCISQCVSVCTNLQGAYPLKVILTLLKIKMIRHG